jgi:hypothetical protein
MVTTPEKHTLSKALLYTIGTSIFAAVVYKSLLRSTGTQSTFLSVFLKPLHFIFGNTALIADAAAAAETPFEDKYFKEYDAWTAYQNHQTLSIAEEDRRKECLENMYYSTVRETIDDFYGDVIMCYDHATLSFAYYARTANIPYKYLETISRKYMIETNAPREIHVDIRDEYNKAKDRNTPASQTNTHTADTADTANTATADTDTAADTAVFVKLKPYNNASNLNLHTTTNDKSHKFTNGTAAANAAANTADAADTERNSNKIIREKANRYSYRGKITEFDENHKTFLAERRARATATTATTTDDTATAATAATAATDATGYTEFKKKWMTAKSAL